MKDYIAHLKFDTLSEDEILKFYEESVFSNKRCLTVTPNLDGMRVSYKNQNLRKFINSADISTIDGVPVKWIAKWLHKKQFKYKISGSDLALDVIKMAAERGYSLLLFGGKEGVADKAKENIIKQYPNLKISTICPEFGHEKNLELSLKYVRKINEIGADINFICTGFPKAELFFASHEKEFTKGLYFFVGATIDFIAGSIKRSPKWMSKCGLEWLYRLFHDFKRLFKRYWLDFWFLFKMFFICVFHKKKFAKIIEIDNK